LSAPGFAAHPFVHASISRLVKLGQLTATGEIGSRKYSLPSLTPNKQGTDQKENSLAEAYEAAGN
jgi:hypothetical protein